MSEQTEAQKAKFEQWAILELMGHVKLAGLVTEESLFGTALGRIDIPLSEDQFTTQYFGGSSVYRLTPTTEEIARAVATNNQPRPVSRWELPAPKEAAAPESHPDFDDSDPYADDAEASPDPEWQQVIDDL